MSDAANRILIALLMLLVVVGAVWLNGAGFNGIYWLAMGVILAMIFEYIICLWCAPRDVMFNSNNLFVFLLFGGLLGADLLALSEIAHKPMILLVLLLAICGADICAWFFGKQIGGDKLWEHLSANKTWAGQIFGIIGGAAAAVLGGYIITQHFVPQLVWIGISLALLSQYGDLTASFIKRRLKIKDFSKVLGAHGGILDRFDGWTYILPAVWIVMKLSQQ